MTHLGQSYRSNIVRVKQLRDKGNVGGVTAVFYQERLKVQCGR